MKRNWILIVIVGIITVVPFFMHSSAEFAGTDGQAEETILTIQPDYKPWAGFIWEPASGEIESLLFAAQAAIGAGIVGYFIGLSRGKRIYNKERQ